MKRLQETKRLLAIYSFNGLHLLSGWAYFALSTNAVWHELSRSSGSKRLLMYSRQYRNWPRGGFRHQK